MAAEIDASFIRFGHGQQSLRRWCLHESNMVRDAVTDEEHSGPAARGLQCSGNPRQE